MTNKDELLPCPFCGSNDLRQVVHDLSDDDREPFGYSISCNVCFVDLPPEPTQSDGVKAWNTRADKAVPEWQPIETAPKDWKRVLVTDGFDVYDAYFRSGDWWQYECGDDWDSVAIKPTHWMPLPQPPTMQGEHNHDK